MSAAFVPTFTAQLHARTAREAWAFAATVMTLLATLLSGVAVPGMLLSQRIVTGMAHDFQLGELRQRDLARLVVRVGAQEAFGQNLAGGMRAGGVLLGEVAILRAGPGLLEDQVHVKSFSIVLSPMPPPPPRRTPRQLKAADATPPFSMRV